MKRYKIAFLLLLFCSLVKGQELIQNGSFEDHYSCPDDVNQLNKCKFWWSLDNFNTPDYFVDCVSGESKFNSVVGVPQNYLGYQMPASGKAYIGIVTMYKRLDQYRRKKFQNDHYVEYVQTKLKYRMIMGKRYHVKMKISLADYSEYFDDHLEFCFSNDSILNRYETEIFICKNCIRYCNTEAFVDTINWHEVSLYYVSKGNEQYLTIGNFYYNGLVKSIEEKIKKNKIKHQVKVKDIELSAYYYIDDVSVKPVDSLGREIILYPELIEKKDTALKFKSFINFDSIRLGESFILHNINFEFNKTELLQESYLELNKLIKLMHENQGIVIEISGYTDDDGTDEYNLQLSLARAKSVSNYIIFKGINRARICCKGYGRTMPIADNKTDEGKSKNRRVEFKLIKKK